MAQATSERMSFSAGSIQYYKKAFKRYHPSMPYPTFQHVGYDKVVPIHNLLSNEDLDSISEGFAETA